MAKYTDSIVKVMVETYTAARKAGNPNSLAIATTVKELSTVHDCDLTAKMVQGKLVAEKVFVAEGAKAKAAVARGPSKQGIVSAVEIELGLEVDSLASLIAARKDTLEKLYMAVKDKVEA